MANNRTVMSTYLTEKITAHVAAILDSYLENPDDVECAVDDIIEAIEQELIWATPVPRQSP